MKRLLSIICCAILLALVCIQVHSRFFTPSTNFFFRATHASDAWAEQLRQRGEPVYVFAGSSETRSGIDPQLMMDEYGLPAVNAAENAGFGLAANAAMAFRYLRPGDTMVLNILSCNDENVPPVSGGVKMAVYLLGTDVFSTGIIEPSWENLGKFLDSNILNAFIVATRYFGRGKRLFKYDEQTVIQPSGWMEISYDDMRNYRIPPACEDYRPKAIQDGAALDTLIKQVAVACHERGIALLVALPASCTNPATRAQGALLALHCTRLGIPVLRDERLGCHPVPEDFSDIPAHPNAKGARTHTRITAELLKSKSYWTEQELVTILQQMGYEETGAPITPSKPHQN